MKAKKKIRIGWKLVKVGVYQKKALLKLQILGAVVTPYARVHLTAGGHTWKEYILTKRRTGAVKVLAAYRLENYTGRCGKTPKQGRKYVRPPPMRSSWMPAFAYRVGRVLTNRLDPDRSADCSYGIHFFDTKREALLWACY
jgi:hypothetical protein